VEEVRLVSSGTEASMSAIRLARAATGRDPVLKFAGAYHGHVDGLLAEAGSGMATAGVPASPGVTEAQARDTTIVPWNDRDAVSSALAEREFAAVIAEPIPANMGIVPPAEGYLPFLRSSADEHGAVLILDEVISGFRVAPGGMCALTGIEPDLVTLGKIVGGGLPAAAYLGRAELMDRLAPDGPVYQAGTLSGNPLAMAAGSATLDLLDAAAYARLEALGAELQRGLETVLADAGEPATVVRVGSILWIALQAAADGSGPRAWHAVRRESAARYAELHHALLERGIWIAPSAFEVAFLSLAHTSADVARVVTTFAEVLAARAAPR
jgi:glutamate-1-semialdehyde 2,1-aminomutase